MALLSDYLDGKFRLIERRSNGLFYATVDGGETWNALSGMTSSELQRLGTLESDAVRNISVNGTLQTKQQGSVSLLLSTRTLSDVSGTSPADGSVLRWNSGSGMYEPSSVSGGNSVTISFGTYGGDSVLDFGTYS